MAASNKISGDDYAEILNLYAHYNLCSDEGDAEGYASCFTREGELVLEGLGVQLSGRAAFIEFKKKDAGGRGGRYRRHWNANIHLTRIDKRTIRGRAYLHAYNGVPGEVPQLADVAVYEDTISLEDGEWLFSSRRLSFDATSFKPPK